jgi:hypothetical protein
MNIRLEQLIAQFVDGSLDEDSSRELLALVQADGPAAKSLSEAWQFHQELRQTLGQPVDQNTAIQRILYFVRANSESDQFVQRVGSHIENSLSAERSKRSPRPTRAAASKNRSHFMAPVLTAAAIFFALTLFWIFQKPPPSIAKTPEPPHDSVHAPSEPAPPELAVVYAAGSDLDVQRGEEKRKLEKGAPLRPGDKITSGASRGSIRLKDGSTIEMDVNTFLAFDETNVQRISLKGRIYVIAAHQPDHSPLVFHTETADAIIVGTAFELSAVDRCTVLQVAEGKVRLDAPLGSMLVSAGFADSIEAGHAPRQPNPIQGADIAQWRNGIEPSDNLLVNGGFDAGFKGWNVKSDSAAPNLAVPSELRAGKKAMQLKFTAPSFKMFTQEVSVEPGATYCAETWIKLDGCTAGFDLRWHSNDKKPPDDAQDKPLQNVGEAKEWKRVSRDFIAPKTAGKVSVIIIIRPEHVAGTAWIDDCVLRKVKTR